MAALDDVSVEVLLIVDLKFLQGLILIGKIHCSKSQSLRIWFHTYWFSCIWAKMWGTSEACFENICTSAAPVSCCPCKCHWLSSLVREWWVCKGSSKHSALSAACCWGGCDLLSFTSNASARGCSNMNWKSFDWDSGTAEVGCFCCCCRITNPILWILTALNAQKMGPGWLLAVEVLFSSGVSIVQIKQSFAVAI